MYVQAAILSDVITVIYQHISYTLYSLPSLIISVVPCSLAEIGPCSHKILNLFILVHFSLIHKHQNVMYIHDWLSQIYILPTYSEPALVL